MEKLYLPGTITKRRIGRKLRADGPSRVVSTPLMGGRNPAVTFLERIDEAQRDREKLAIGAATVKKYSDDQSGNLASTLAFWAFFSIFPLLLVFITILGYTVPRDQRTDILGRVAELLPIIDGSSVNGLSGAWWVLLVGALTALWSGSAVVRTAQDAFDSVWEVPRKDRASFGETLGRSLGFLVAIGLGLILATIISSFVSGKQTVVDLGWFGHLGGYVVSLALDLSLFIVAFRLLTTRAVSFRSVLPGAILAGVSFFVLQRLSSLIISKYLDGAQDTYGTFATVITILWWFYLQAQITLLGAQLNIVLEERLYPRTLVGEARTDADQRALAAYVGEAVHYPNQEVETRFRERDRPARAS